MSNKANERFTVNAGGGWSYLAQIRLHSGSLATQAMISGITRTITNPRTRQSVTDTLVVESVVYDTPQANDDLWEGETYNFLDAVPASRIATRERHTLQYTITPVAGEVIKTREIDIEGD